MSKMDFVGCDLCFTEARTLTKCLHCSIWLCGNCYAKHQAVIAKA